MWSAQWSTCQAVPSTSSFYSVFPLSSFQLHLVRDESTHLAFTETFRKLLNPEGPVWMKSHFNFNLKPVLGEPSNNIPRDLWQWDWLEDSRNAFWTFNFYSRHPERLERYLLLHSLRSPYQPSYRKYCESSMESPCTKRLRLNTHISANADPPRQCCCLSINSLIRHSQVHLTKNHQFGSYDFGFNFFLSTSPFHMESPWIQNWMKQKLLATGDTGAASRSRLSTRRKQNSKVYKIFYSDPCIKILGDPWSLFDQKCFVCVVWLHILV